MSNRPQNIWGGLSPETQTQVLADLSAIYQQDKGKRGIPLS